MLCDSHTHIDQFTDEEVEVIVRDAEAAGVGMIIDVGTTLTSCLRAIELSGRYDIVYAAVGLHPQDLQHAITADELDAMRDMARGCPKVACVGETGLDFQAASPDRTWQEEAFRAHIRLARELGKPIGFHAREAQDEILAMMREERAEEAGAIWHYFEYSAEKAREALDMGFYLSLAKPLLRLADLQETVKGIPLERIVLETDSYPQPWKENPAARTVPAHVAQVAAKVAAIKGVSVAEVARVTTENLRRALGMGKRDSPQRG